MSEALTGDRPKSDAGRRGFSAGDYRPAMRRDRSRARAWFLQVHYRWETARGDLTLFEALAETCEQRVVGASRIPYVTLLVKAYDDQRPLVEAALAAALDNWRIERVSVMDRGVLRLGATEILLVEDIPAKVAIQEAVRLAERYGGAESPRFVNGVLDAVYRAAR